MLRGHRLLRVGHMERTGGDGVEVVSEADYWVGRVKSIRRFTLRDADVRAPCKPLLLLTRPMCRCAPKALAAALGRRRERRSSAMGPGRFHQRCSGSGPVDASARRYSHHDDYSVVALPVDDSEVAEPH